MKKESLSCCSSTIFGHKTSKSHGFIRVLIKCRRPKEKRLNTFFHRKSFSKNLTYFCYFTVNCDSCTDCQFFEAIKKAKCITQRCDKTADEQA